MTQTLPMPASSSLEDILLYQKIWEDVNKNTWLSDDWAKELLKNKLVTLVEKGKNNVSLYKLTPAGRLLAESIA